VNLLLDTHAFLWAIQDDGRLPHFVRSLIDDPGNRVFVSVVSAWEIAIKAGLGRLSIPEDGTAWFNAGVRLLDFELVGITVRHVMGVRSLPPLHKDPFDRILIAQATAEDLTLVTKDRLFRRYDLQVIW
jgi:PIN domain nuclease of toxin-antitoxin system